MSDQNGAHFGNTGRMDSRPIYPRYNAGIWMRNFIDETNVDDDSSTISTSAPRNTKRRRNSRRTCVTTSMVGTALVLILLGVSLVPLILYLIEKDQYKYYKADASITFQGIYNKSLGDLSTDTSKDFQQGFCEVMEQTQATKFKDTYSGCLVTQIKNGSIIVTFNMYYYAKVTVKSDDVKSEITIFLKAKVGQMTFASTFNIVADANSLTVSLQQTGEDEYQSAFKDVRFKPSLLISTTESTTSILVTTVDINSDNTSTTVQPETTFTDPSDSTNTNPESTIATVPPETSATNPPDMTTIVQTDTTVTFPPTAKTSVPPVITTTNSPVTTTSVPPDTTTTTISTDTTTSVPPDTTTTTISTDTTTSVPPDTTTITNSLATTASIRSDTTTTTNSPATTTPVPHDSTSTNSPVTTTKVPPDTTTTNSQVTTTKVPPETNTTNSPTTITTLPETTNTNTPATTTTALSETTSINTPASTTVSPDTTVTTNTNDTTSTATKVSTTTTITTTYTATTVSPDHDTTISLSTTENISDTTVLQSSTTLTFVTTTTDNDTTTAATTMSQEPFAVVVMKHSDGEIGKEAYMPCTIEIKSGDWTMIYIYQTHNNSIEPKIATISKDGTETVFTSDPLLVPTFNISGSQIEAAVSFNFSNFDSSKCSMREYTFTCSIEMTNGNTFNSSAKFSLIAPLTEPSLALIQTRYIFNQTANMSMAGIDAICNATKDSNSDFLSIIAMQIQNVSGDAITSFVDFTSYNISTKECGEHVFFHLMNYIPYRSDMNGSILTCYVEAGGRTVVSENITLTFLE